MRLGAVPFMFFQPVAWVTISEFAHQGVAFGLALLPALAEEITKFFLRRNG